jgi:hypothetical protein
MVFVLPTEFHAPGHEEVPVAIFVELNFWSTTKLIWQYLDFSTNSYGFSKLADLK